MITRLARCIEGSMAIETAVIAPVLITLAIGAFEASSMVARQHELQSAASEVETIALTASAGVETQVATIKSIIQTSIKLDDDQVDVTLKYRCNADDFLVDTEDSCSEDALVSQYVQIDLRDHYTPIWNDFGIGDGFDYNVSRTVQVR